MTAATVLLIGTGELQKIPEFLHLGAVVLVAPDRETLRSWQVDDESRWDEVHETDSSDGVVLDLSGRRVMLEGDQLPITELEFKILAALLTRPGRAWSFSELRAAGWGEGPDLAGDVDALRALVQRLRRKLDARGGRVHIEAVRGYGYRAAIEDVPTESSVETTRGSA